MRNLILIFLVIIGSNLGVLGQDIPSITNDSIVFKKMVHNYDTIIQGSDGKCEFQFTNKGKSPLILSRVKSSCGCTVPEWPREPILPGQMGIIKVKYNTAKVGRFHKSITVTSNAVNTSVILRIKGYVIAKQ